MNKFLASNDTNSEYQSATKEGKWNSDQKKDRNTKLETKSSKYIIIKLC